MKNQNIKEHLDLLGRKASDRVTRFRGIVSCISHDLYGCIQAVLTPPVDKDGKTVDGKWFDVSRLRVEGNPVMERPDWDFGQVAEGRKGPAEKPAFD